MKNYKILIVGRIYNKHLIRFVQNLKLENPEAQVDIFSYYKEGPLPEGLEGLLNMEYYLYITKKKRINYLQRVYDIVDIIGMLKKLTQIKQHYDIINIHYPHYIYTFLFSQFRRLSDRIILTPWGSDVYRCGFINLQILKTLYYKADYITAVNDKFKNDLVRILKVNHSKIRVLDMASETIDYILNNKSIITKDKAKKALNVEGNYIICCGYNGQKAQQHKDIISAIYKVKERLPNNVVLFLPFMYGGDNAYKKEIVNLTEAYGLKFVLFDKYLKTEDMFLLEQATDLMIHIQTTDASSCSIQEFILLEKKVINGEWLKYPQLEFNREHPYYELKSNESLAETIITAFSTNISISKQTLRYIESCGWKSWIKKWNAFFESLVA